MAKYYEVSTRSLLIFNLIMDLPFVKRGITGKLAAIEILDVYQEMINEDTEEQFLAIDSNFNSLALVIARLNGLNIYLARLILCSLLGRFSGIGLSQGWGKLIEDREFFVADYRSTRLQELSSEQRTRNSWKKALGVSVSNDFNKMIGGK